MRHPARCCLVLALAAPMALAAGCSDSGDPAQARPPATAAGSVADALPLTARVVQGDELAGFTAPPALALDLAAISGENEVSAVELRRRGMVRAAKTELSGPPMAFGISAVAELRTPAQARAEAARLLAVNGSSEPGLAARAITVTGIPGARGARKTGRRDGQDFVAFEVVWADGVRAHELFVLGRAGDVRQADVLAAAAAVHARTAGEPAGGD